MKKFFKNEFTAGKKAAVLTAAVLCAAAILSPVAAGAADYIAENDPFITLSYLQEVFAPSFSEQIKAEIAGEAEEKPTETISVGYEVIELSKGQILTSENGTVELIVRPGSSAVVISDIPDNGLSDISEMKEITDGCEVGINHALIIPRNDGRGIEITSDKAYVLVRGDYKISG